MVSILTETVGSIIIVMIYAILLFKSVISLPMFAVISLLVASGYLTMCAFIRDK